MVEYVAIGVDSSQQRERSHLLFLTGVVLMLITIVASTIIILLVVMNLHYYELFRELPKLLYKNMILDESLVTDVPDEFRLVCYYRYPLESRRFDDLRLLDVNESLCTHINIGMVDIVNSSIRINEQLQQILREDVPLLRKQNPNLKLLLWVGGGDNVNGIAFAQMVKKHDTRKIFIKSLKEALHFYKLDGVDLDWEFPSAYDKERQHFSQLLYEIKAEYKRERKDYMLTVAVAAVEGIAFYAYDIRELNLYADFINLMSYDYHFYSKGAPFTGLNAPLYARKHEGPLLDTLNINASVNWWIQQGIQPDKLVVGLPTYGHSYTLVSPFNTKIGAPAEDDGRVGNLGFATYTEICYFMNSNIAVSMHYDNETCSPYLNSAMEWISYENEDSIACKTKYIKSMKLGGVMIFSLNSDDIKGFCRTNKQIDAEDKLYETNLYKDDIPSFPLINTVRRVLLG